MNPSSSELERLISRYLDDEATPQERRELNVRMRSDPAVEALVDDYASLDRELGNALRGALGRTRVLPVGRSLWARAGSLVGLAAAACLALMVWMRPVQPAGRPADRQPVHAGVPTSWFAPAVPQDQTVQRVNRSFERPQRRQRQTEREWILVPGERPGEYLIIEVKRVRTRAVAIQVGF